MLGNLTGYVKQLRSYLGVGEQKKRLNTTGLANVGSSTSSNPVGLQNLSEGQSYFCHLESYVMAYNVISLVRVN
jgi:hypothetical protein